MPCSYCNQAGHNINLCVHPTIFTNFQRAKQIYLNVFAAHFNSDNIDIQSQFQNIIDRNFLANSIRVIAIKFANARARYNKQQCISALWFYFNINIIHPEEQQWLQTRQTNRFVEPDPIPAFAQDLANPTNNDSDDEDDLGLTWYIDRTPDVMAGFVEEPQIQIQPQIDLRNYRIPVPLTQPQIQIQPQIQPQIDLRNYRIPVPVPVIDTYQTDRNSIGNLYNQHLEQRREIVAQRLAQNRQELDQRIQQLEQRIQFEQRFQLEQRISQKFDINIIMALDDDITEEEDCPICLISINPDEIIKLNCNHKFCGCCVKQSMIKYQNQKCALCRAPTTSVSVKTEQMYNLLAEYCI